jgi:hypothetical protein
VREHIVLTSCCVRCVPSFPARLHRQAASSKNAEASTAALQSMDQASGALKKDVAGMHAALKSGLAAVAQ